MEKFFGVMNSTSVYDQCIDWKADLLFSKVADQQMTYSIIMKTSSSLSMIGSFSIIVDILCFRRQEQQQQKNHNRLPPIHRILVGMSVFDVIGSFFGGFMNSWMIPPWTGWWGATGSESTCTTQGFFLSLSMVAILGYVSLLASYYLAKVTFRWDDARFARSIECWSHIAILVCALIYALPSIPMELNSPDCNWFACVPIGYPEELENNDILFTLFPDKIEPDYAYLIALGIVVFLSNTFVWTALFAVCCSVRKQQKRSKNIARTTGENNNNNREMAEKETTTNNGERFEDELVMDDEDDANLTTTTDSRHAQQESIRLRNDLFFYIMAMHVSYMFPTQMTWIVGTTKNRRISPMGDFVRMSFYAFLLPSHGMWNWLTYYVRSNDNDDEFLFPTASKVEMAPLVVSDTGDVI